MKNSPFFPLFPSFFEGCVAKAPNRLFFKKTAACFGLASLLTGASQADTIQKAPGNTDPLNTSPAWIGGVVPGFEDIALFGESANIPRGATTIYTTGGNLDLGRITLQILPSIANTQINIDNNTINLHGVDGVGISNLSYRVVGSGFDATLHFGSGTTINVANSQIWNAVDRTINVNGVITGGPDVTLTRMGRGIMNFGAGNSPLINTFQGALVIGGGSLGGATTATNINNRFANISSLTLTGGATNLNFNNTSVDFNPNNLVNSAASLTLRGGNLTVTGKASTVVNQSFAGTTLERGSTTILLANQPVGTDNAINLNLGEITRNEGGILSVAVPTGVGLASIVTSTGGTSGILKTAAGVAYATYGAGGTSSWAVKTAANEITAFAFNDFTFANGGTLGAAQAGADVAIIEEAPAVTNVTTTNLSTLYLSNFGSGTARTLTIGAGEVLSTGGILGASTGAGSVFTINGTGTLTAATGTNELVLLNNGDQSINYQAIITDNASGAVSVTTGGTGTSNMSAANTYTGRTYVASGIHRMNGATSGNAASEYVVGGNGQLNINGQTVAIGALSGNGAVTLGNNGGTMTVGAKGINTVFDGIITSNPGQTTFINKVGAGTLVLNGYSLSSSSGAYTGTTNINEGSLIVNGSMALSATTIVNNSGILGGKGSVSNVTVNGGGAIAPGFEGIGTLTATDVTLGDTSELIFELLDMTSDLLSLSGSFLDGNSGTADTFTFSLSGGVFGQTYTLVSFANTNFTDVSQFHVASGGTDGTFSLTSNSLQFTAVPEPSTYALFALGALGLIAVRRRRK